MANNTDTVVRTKHEVTEEKVPAAPKPVTTSEIDSGVKPPYTSYGSKPYPADYFDLGDNWEVFNEELGIIHEYLKKKIENGEIADSTEAAEHELKSLEKINNLKHEERAVVKTGTIASYVKFLMETEGIKRNWRKYGDF